MGSRVKEKKKKKRLGGKVKHKFFFLKKGLDIKKD
jgi:hypothetical protein